MREFIMLTIANNLPRFRLSDRVRHIFLKWAEIKITGKATLWWPFTIRPPLGGVKNIEIGKGAVVAAGSVVTNNIERNVVVGGAPAKFIKKTTD